LDKPLKDWGNLDEIMRENCGQTVTAPLSGSFTGDIVITPMSMIDFVGTMLGLFMGDMPLITGTSIWKDKLNQKGLIDDKDFENKDWKNWISKCLFAWIDR